MEILTRLKKDVATRNKVILTFSILMLLLIGYRIPLPGINQQYIKMHLASLTGGNFGGFIGAMTGNSFEQMSIFALSITPYISASILLQLLTVFVPKLEEISKDGSVGHQKMQRLTVVVGALIAIVESVALAVGFGQKGLFINYSAGMVLFATAVWTCGACFLIWVGQTITNKLIGNGITLILLFNILTTLPDNIELIFTSLSNGKSTAVQIIVVVTMALVILLIFAYVVVLEAAEKRISITNSRNAGLRMNAANNNHLPLKLNMGGVMPIILSTTAMSLPVMLGQVLSVTTDSFFGKILTCFNQSNWFDINNPIASVGVLIFIPLTYFFSSFYAKISFNPRDIADNLKRNGSIVDGIRPGLPTAEYLEKQAKSVRGVGTTMLIGVALIPTLISGLFQIGGLSFGGTTIIIVVSAILETRNVILANSAGVTYKSLIKRR